MIKEAKPYSNSTDLVTESVVAIKRTIKIMPKEEIFIDLIIGVGEDKEETIKLVKKYENTK